MCWMAAYVALTAYSAYSAAQTRKDTARYQSQVAANNSKLASWQAADAKERGDKAAADTRRKYAALQGTQTAALAARGLDISEGSANAILTDTDFFGDYDQRVVRSNAEREAYGFKVRAGNFAGDAAFYSHMAASENPLLSGAMAGATSYFGASGGLGGGSGTVASKWYGGSAGSATFSGRPYIGNLG